MEVTLSVLVIENRISHFSVKVAINFTAGTGSCQQLLVPKLAAGSWLQQPPAGTKQLFQQPAGKFFVAVPAATGGCGKEEEKPTQLLPVCNFLVCEPCKCCCVIVKFSCMFVVFCKY